MAAEGLAQLEAHLGYQFRSPERLERALTHASWLADNSPPRIEARNSMPGGDSFLVAAGAERDDNEKYEFLGDAVLSFVVSEQLLAAFPTWQEGRLSKARAGLVNSDALAAVARGLDLGSYLLLGRGEEKTGGRQKTSLLADAYEAVVAAIYLDGGLEAARGFIRQSFLTAALQRGMESGEGLGHADHKSRLQEFLQAQGWPAPEYRVVSETGPDHQKLFEMEARVPGRAAAVGAGANKKEAEQTAAGGLLAQLLEPHGKNLTAAPADASSRIKEKNG